MSNLENYDHTPTEADLDDCYGGNFLNATVQGDKKSRDKILRVRKKALPQQGGGTKTKFVISFASIDKEMVLNATNKTILVDALGRNPANWIGAEVGLFTEPTMMAGKATRGLRLRVLSSAAPAPLAALKPHEPWPDESDDPGPEFVDAAE